jgi:protein-tyrosine phosphatase
MAAAISMHIFWINGFTEGSLAIMRAPAPGKALEGDVLAWKGEGVEVVVSLLEADEIASLDADRELALCNEAGIEFLSFPIADKSVPTSIADTEALARQLMSRITEGRPVAVHCRAGIGRSALIAGCVLICFGIDTATALDLIGDARGRKVPETREQAQWLAGFEKSMMARR